MIQTLDDDDDDTQSVDFLTDKSGIHPDDDESLNSSRSSLQQHPSAVFKGLVITKQLSGTSQPVQNPIYTGMPSNINHSNRRFSIADINPSPHVNHVPPTQVEHE